MSKYKTLLEISLLLSLAAIFLYLALSTLFPLVLDSPEYITAIILSFGFTIAVFITAWIYTKGE